MAQLNVKLDQERLSALRRYADRRRTPISWLIRDYVDYLVAGGSPVRPPADDVAEYLKRVPGCYFWVGTRNEARGLVWDHHHPRFDLDEAALPVGVELLSRIAERYFTD